MSDISLTLCMIVRDEATMLPGFLTSVRGLWDELIAVDTGSRDATPSLIRAAGGTVLDLPWQDDFAAARNASLAPARGRWILFLDADERPDAQLAAALRCLATQDRRAGAATVVLRNELPDGGRREARLLRCFRNTPEIRFRHRIHEDVADDVAAFLARQRLELRHLPGGIEHLGYVRELAASRHKKERDVRLLRAALADDPDDLYCRFKLLELARFWDDRDLWQTEADAARRALEATPRSRLAGRAWSGELAALIAQALPAESALAWLDAQACRVEPGPAWHLRRGLLLETAGRLTDAEAAYRACLRNCETPPAGVASLPPARPLLGMCRIEARRGDVVAAADIARRAAATAPRDPEALLAVVSFLSGAAAAAFATAHARTCPEAVVPLAQALLTTGRAEAALALLDSTAAGRAEGLGLAVLALALGVGREVAIDTEGGTAERRLRSWLEALWSSRRTELRESFAERAEALLETFPWLDDWLTERGMALSFSRR